MATKKSNDSQHRLSPEPAWTPIHPFPTIFHLSNPRKCPSTSFEPSSPLDPPNPQVTGTFTKHSPIHFNSSNSMGSSSKEALIIESEGGVGVSCAVFRSALDSRKERRGGGKGRQRGSEEGLTFQLPSTLLLSCHPTTPHHLKTFCNHQELFIRE